MAGELSANTWALPTCWSYHQLVGYGPPYPTRYQQGSHFQGSSAFVCAYHACGFSPVRGLYIGVNFEGNWKMFLLLPVYLTLGAVYLQYNSVYTINVHNFRVTEVWASPQDQFNCICCNKLGISGSIIYGSSVSSMTMIRIMRCVSVGRERLLLRMWVDLVGMSGCSVCYQILRTPTMMVWRFGTIRVSAGLLIWRVSIGGWSDEPLLQEVTFLKRWRRALVYSFPHSLESFLLPRSSVDGG